MKTIKELKVSLVCLAGLFGAACTEDIEAGKAIDESPYSAVTRIDGMLLDAATNRSEKVVELRDAISETGIYFSMTKLPASGVDVKIELDADYVDSYNKKHGTDFILFPVENVTIARNGELLLAPDEIRSEEVAISLAASDELEGGATYLLPLKAVSMTDGINCEAAGRMVYLVRNLRNLTSDFIADDPYEGLYTNPDKSQKTILYIETNDCNPLNALEFRSGKTLNIDYLVLFAFNINYDKINNRIYIYSNASNEWLLRNNDAVLQRLRKHGIKVIAGILGNHDEAGIAQLSDLGARQFAAELAAFCKAYNLDGVAFDDEYAEKLGDDFDYASHPLLAPNDWSRLSRLLYETKLAMPDKTIIGYQVGKLDKRLVSIDGVEMGECLDIVVPDYGRTPYVYPGMTKMDCAGGSYELMLGKGSTSGSGYGYTMYFGLAPRYYSSNNQLSRFGKGSPTHFYKNNDLTRYPISQLSDYVKEFN
ncbi:hypothetical protein B5E60_02940 [Alistipes sp. An116]|nr:hypothetical protein B5E60_02940 [Alistipes sp. An116]